MAEATAKPRLDLVIHFKINEEEARALDALSSYGDNGFIQMFYDNMGKSYMRDYEAGMRQFLQSIRGVVGPAIRMVDESRKALEKRTRENSNVVT